MSDLSFDLFALILICSAFFSFFLNGGTNLYDLCPSLPVVLGQCGVLEEDRRAGRREKLECFLSSLSPVTSSVLAISPF